MVQFECSRVMRPLLSFTFGSHLGAPFFLHSGYYSEVNDSKECITLGHSKRTIWSPQNLFYTRIFHFLKDGCSISFSCLYADRGLHHTVGPVRFGFRKKRTLQWTP